MRHTLAIIGIIGLTALLAYGMYDAVFKYDERNLLKRLRHGGIV